MRKKLTKEHMIKRYKQVLKELIDNNVICMYLMMRGEVVKIDSNNRYEYIEKIKELIKELEQDIS
ncbi:MAG: hypothetical protein E7212_10300 [Clostridium sartagoforme]|nr:hypothetical protein [Clostridium sartagoforme]